MSINEDDVMNVKCSNCDNLIPKDRLFLPEDDVTGWMQLLTSFCDKKDLEKYTCGECLKKEHGEYFYNVIKKRVDNKQ